MTHDASSVANDHERDEREARYNRRIQKCADLAAFIDEVVAQCDAVASATSWAEVAAALRAGVHRFLGGPTTADRWGAETTADRWRRVERGAYDAVLDAIDELSLLYEVDTDPPSYDSVRQTLARQLDRALPSGTTLGRGITVGPIRDFAGADFDLLMVVGMTEEAFPPRIRENPVLRSAERDDPRTAHREASPQGRAAPLRGRDRFGAARRLVGAPGRYPGSTWTASLAMVYGGARRTQRQHPRPLRGARPAEQEEALSTYS